MENSPRFSIIGVTRGPYHGHEYGFPRRDDAGLFERLVLGINQTGLSWATTLKKHEGLRSACGCSGRPSGSPEV